MISTYKDKVLDEVAEDGASIAKWVKEYKHILIEVVATGFTGKLQALMSINDLEEKPDFNATKGIDNAWGTVQIKDLEDASGKNGDDGVSYTAETSVRFYEVNTNRICWLGFLIDDYSAGNISVKLVGIKED